MSLTHNLASRWVLKPLVVTSFSNFQCNISKPLPSHEFLKFLQHQPMSLAIQPLPTTTPRSHLHVPSRIAGAVRDLGFAGRLEPLRASAGSRSQIKPILNSPEMKVGKGETGQGFLTNILMIIDDVVMTFEEGLISHDISKPICSWKTSVDSGWSGCRLCLKMSKLASWQAPVSLPATFLMCLLFIITWTWCHMPAKSQNRFCMVLYMDPVAIQKIAPNGPPYHHQQHRQRYHQQHILSSTPSPPWVVRILLSLAPENGATDHTITSVGTGGPDGGRLGSSGS